jgi:pyruvate/2-oxoglutarate dehydrogenase complex dihydrolipoamide dehydrogenase (E3) component
MEYDLVAVGGGTAGLVAAAGAAYLGLRAALVEREALGGDCLWTGCVPSKALIASARLAHTMAHAESLGLRGAAPGHAFSAIMERVRKVRGEVARHDDPERFRAMGVDVHFGEARFRSRGTLEVDGTGRLASKRIILATGAAPLVPSVPGLEEAGYLTHATAFQQNSLPSSLIILGAGPVGLEFAQVYRRLGAQVDVVEVLPQILPREDRRLAQALRDILEAEGIRFRTGTSPVEVRLEEGGKSVLLEDGSRIVGQEIFVATGRSPATAGLEPNRGGVETDGTAVRVDRTLRTSVSGVWAAGDVTGGMQFTHVADYMAKTALRNSVFPLKKKVSYRTIPRVTYTDPEVAHVGIGREEGEARGADTWVYPFRELDRAMVEGQTQGFVQVTADSKGRILGASILGHGAGELLMPLVMAMEHGIPLSKISDTVFPYPTRAEGIKRVANTFQRARLAGTEGRILRKVVSWLK